MRFPRARLLQVVAMEYHAKAPNLRRSSNSSPAAAAAAAAAPASQPSLPGIRRQYGEHHEVTSHLAVTHFLFQIPPGATPSFDTPMVGLRCGGAK
jgi:hypothetical protein